MTPPRNLTPIQPPNVGNSMYGTSMPQNMQQQQFSGGGVHLGFPNPPPISPFVGPGGSPWVNRVPPIVGTPGAGTSGGLMNSGGMMRPPPVFGSPGLGTSGGLMTGGGGGQILPGNSGNAEANRQFQSIPPQYMQQILPGWAGYLQWLQMMQGRR